MRKTLITFRTVVEWAVLTSCYMALLPFATGREAYEEWKNLMEREDG